MLPKWSQKRGPSGQRKGGCDGPAVGEEHTEEPKAGVQQARGQDAVKRDTLLGDLYSDFQGLEWAVRAQR